MAGVSLGSPWVESARDASLLALAGTLACACGALRRAHSGPLLLLACALLGATLDLSARLAALPAGVLARWIVVERERAPDAASRVTIVSARGRIEGLPVPPTARSRAFGGEPRGSFLLRLDPEEAAAESATRGRVRVLYEGAALDLRAGDRVRVLGRIETPRAPRLPGESDARLRALDTDVAASLVTRSACIDRLGRPAPIAPTAIVGALRARALARLAERLDGDVLGLALALVLGIPDGIPTELRERHAHAGALPHLAISGLHVALVSLPVGWCLGRALGRRRGAAGLAIVLCAYAAFTGGNPPAQRGALAAAAIAVAAPARRRAEGPVALAMAAALEVILAAPRVRSASFQLSYAAVLGMVLARPAMPSRAKLGGSPWRRVVRGVAAPSRIALVALLSTAGLAAEHFGELAPMSLLTSVPLAALIPAMLAAGSGALLPGPVGDASAAGFRLLASVELALVHWADAAPATPLRLGPIPSTAIGLAGAGLLAAIARAPRLGAALAIGSALAALTLPLQRSSGSLDLWLLDVGHGQVAVLRLPDGAAVLVDAGGSRIRIGRDVARVCARLGIARWSIVSISHDDADHGNALDDLLARVPADAWIAGPGSAWAARLARATGRPTPAAPRLERSGCRVEWTALDRLGASDNDRGLVTWVRYAGRTILLPGDLEAAGVAALRDAHSGERADVLVMPHHGLDNAQIEPLLDALAPEIALASCGDRYSTARAEALLALRGLPLHATRDLGSLHLRIDSRGGVEVRALGARTPEILRRLQSNGAAQAGRPGVSSEPKRSDRARRRFSGRRRRASTPESRRDPRPCPRPRRYRRSPSAA